MGYPNFLHVYRGLGYPNCNKRWHSGVRGMGYPKCDKGWIAGKCGGEALFCHNGLQITTPPYGLIIDLSI